MKMLTVVAAVLLLTGCASMPRRPAAATAEIKNAQGAAVGSATLTEGSGGVRIVVEARGLTPGPHGVHIHATGTCDPPAFTSAGGHFNPDKKQHGVLNPAGHHAGDLPNMAVAADGTGRLDTTSAAITLSPGPLSLFDGDGSAVVIHAAPDDLRSDPTGNSGARVACGVIVKK